MYKYSPTLKDVCPGSTLVMKVSSS